MDISVTIDDSEVQAALQRLTGKLKNMEPVMNEIGLHYVKRVQENFDNERSPDGRPWQRLSATTLMMQLGRKKGFKPGGKEGKGKSKGYLSAKGRTYLQGKKILTDSHNLRESIHPAATNNSVTIGTNGIRYAAIHQFGGPIKGFIKGTMPARPYLALNRGSGTSASLELAEKDKLMILEIINDWLSKP